MVSASQYVEGTSVKWAALASAIFGGAFLAFFEGIMGAILGYSQTITDLWTGFGEFLAGFVETWVGGPTSAIATGWATLEAAVGSAGLFGYFAVSLAFAFLLYAVAWGVSEIG